MMRRIIIRPQAPLIYFRPTNRMASEKKSLLLSVERPESLTATTVRLSSPLRPNLRYFSASKVASRLLTFTYADWSEYLGVIGAFEINKAILMPLSEGAAVKNISEAAGDWLAGNINFVKPLDFYNFLRFVQIAALFKRRMFDQNRFMQMQRTPQIPNYVHEDVFKWFLRNLDTLEYHAFFEILNQKTRYMMLQNVSSNYKAKLDDILKIISHGIMIVQSQNSEIIGILQLLYAAEYYGHIFSKDSIFASFSQALIEALEKRDMVANRYDLYHSLLFLSGLQISYQHRIAGIPSNRTVFRRYANGNYTAWKWLKNSIEMVFEDEELVDMRQMAAVAAVRAYKWKAVDFSPDDVDNYLTLAAQPFQSYPTDIFDLSKHALSPKAVRRLLYLITAIRSAAISDLPRLGKLSVRLDDAYWNKFFDMVENEAPNLGPRVSWLYSLNSLKQILPTLMPDELPFVSNPISRERSQRLSDLQKKFVQM